MLHQLLPVLDPGDAVSNHALALRAVLRSSGVDSEIFCERTHPNLAHQARSYRDYPGGPAIYHVAIGSRLADWLATRDEPLVLDHHNLTPARFFEVWDPPLVHGTAWGRQQLAQLAPRCVLGLADSRFNELELIEAGCRSTAVVPILFDPSTFDEAADPAAVDQLQTAKAGGGADWLFVGRMVPNKCQHDVIAALAMYRRTTDPAARLWLVGGASSPVYERTLRAAIDALGLADAVTLTGPVAHARLTAHFQQADVFVCLSEHEGFCVPVLEAFSHSLPVVAYRAAAVPETVGEAGLLLSDKSPAMVAAAVGRVLDDERLRQHLVAVGNQRLDHFSLAHSRARFVEAIAPVLEQQ